MSYLSRALLLLLAVFCFTQTVSADYVEADGYEFLHASALAYCSPDSIQQWSCGPACQNLTQYQYYFSEVFDVSVGETLSYTMIYSTSSKRFIVSFRGTVGGVELLLEVLQGVSVTYDLSSVPGAVIDEYFYDHYVNVLRDSFTSNFANAYAQFADYEFIFTGHSLGASFTTLAAFDAVTSGLISADKIMVYNYGMPRLGNYILAQAIEASVKAFYRVVHWKDIVPHVPPCLTDSQGACVQSSDDEGVLDKLLSTGLPVWPAWHVTTEIFYNEDNSQYTVCDGAEDPTCSDQFPVIEETITDHLFYFGVFMECPGHNGGSSLAGYTLEDIAAADQKIRTAVWKIFG